MKRTILSLVLAMTLILSLSGCSTNNGKTAARNDTNQNSGTQNGDTFNNGSTNNPANGNRSYNDYGSYAAPGYNGSTSSDSYNDLMRGRSYEEMLRNGRIHDTDGILTDGENAGSNW